MGSVERRQYGVASATVGTMRLTGQMLSLGLATLLFALFIGPVQITPEYYADFLTAIRVGFTVFRGAVWGGRVRQSRAGEGSVV